MECLGCQRSPCCTLMNVKGAQLQKCISINPIVQLAAQHNAVVCPVPPSTLCMCMANYHPSSSSHGQLFRLCWASPALHSQAPMKNSKVLILCTLQYLLHFKLFFILFFLYWYCYICTVADPGGESGGSGSPPPPLQT